MSKHPRHGSVWPSVTVGAVSERVTDGTHQPPKFAQEGIPFLFVSNIRHGCLTFETSKFIDEVTYSHLTRRCPIEVGDVLFTTVGSYGNSAEVLDERRFAFQRHLAHIKPNRSKVLPRFLRMVLESPHVREQIDAKVRGIAQKTLNLNELRDLRFALPPIDEQRRIVAILDQADGIRRKRREAIVLAESFLRSAFLEMFGDPVGNPRGWEQRPLSEVADIASGVTKGRNFGLSLTIQVPYMRVANVQDGRLDLREVKSVEILPRELERFKLLDGDVLVTEGGDPDKLGRGAVWRGQVQDCIHQNHIFRIRPDLGLLLPEYLSAQLGSTRGKRYFSRAAKQTTGIASINMSQLKAFPVLIPPIALQRRFAVVVAGSEQLVQRQRAVLVETERLFAAIVAEVFGR